MATISALLAALSRWRDPADARIRTPTILQMDALECGAAALGIVLAHHGRWVPLEELRQRCGVSRDGTKASNILKAARHYGLSARGFKKEPEQLTELPLPSIIHWNFNHFVVFEGSAGKHAYINDPASGRRRVSDRELSESFTGVALAFEPAAEFRRMGARPPLWSALWQRLAGARREVIQVLLATGLLALLGVVIPVFSKVFVDNVLVDRLDGWLKPLLLGMAGAALLQGCLIWLQRSFLLRLEIKLNVAMAAQFTWHLLRLPIAFFNQRHAGDLTRRIALNDDIATLLSAGLATAAINAVAVVLYGAVMALINPLLAAIAMPWAVINVLGGRVARRHLADGAQRLIKEQNQLAGATLSIIRVIESIKAGGHEQDSFSRWAGHHARALSASRDFDLVAITINALLPLSTAFSYITLLCVGSLQVMHGAISVGELVAFLALATLFAEPINQIVMQGANLQQVRAGVAALGDVLAHDVDSRAAPTQLQLQLQLQQRTTQATRLRGTVSLRNVSFGYNPNEPPLIENFNLEVRAGTRVALVGASGSGKSTLGRLLCGLYVPSAGEILFDGRPLQDIPQADLADGLAYVDQDVFLFEGTVRDNLTLWDTSVDEARLSRALHDAAIFDDITLRPGRYDHRIAEAGINFSGGQRQRLEIARALIHDPAVLVLDEATAALDPVVERQIDERLRLRGCTCIVIAHRLSTIRDCDAIVVIDNGRLIDEGSHEQLLDRCPGYARLVQAQ